MVAKAGMIFEVSYLSLLLLSVASAFALDTKRLVEPGPTTRPLGEVPLSLPEVADGSVEGLQYDNIAGSTLFADTAGCDKRRSRTLAAKRKRRIYHPNRPSAYVSLGKVRPFTGDVYPPSALVLALEARTYRRELILMTDTRPRAALQLYDNLAQLGLVHVLWLANSQSVCAAADELLTARSNLRRTQPQQQHVASVQLSGGAAGDRSLRAVADQEAAAVVSPLNLSAAIVTLAAASAAAANGRASIIANLPGAGASPAAAADVGCTWYDLAFPEPFIGHRRMMMKRIMLLARIVRLGVSVLSLDSDVIVQREPYRFLKNPPYRAAHMVVGKSVRGGSIVNTGVMYFQNVSRTGPVSWLLREAVDRNLRWLEQPNATTEAQGVLAPREAQRRGCWDQFLFADAVLTAVTGRLSLYYCVRPPERAAAGGGGGGRMAAGGGWRAEEESAGSWNTQHRVALGLPEKMNPVELLTREETAVSDPDLLTLVGANSYVTQWANLTIPPRDSPPLLPDEPGYMLPPRLAHGHAAAFNSLLNQDDELNQQRQQQQQVAAAGSGRGRLLHEQQQQGADSHSGGGQAGPVVALSPLPPAHRDAERMSYAADWLVSGWAQRGVLGYWDPALNNGVPRQVFAHLVRAPGPTSIGKEAVRMQYGEYSWELAALAEGGPFPFLGSANASELPRVVALLPEVDTTTASPVQWSNTARGLAQLALLTGRRVAWPAVPCASKWVQPNPGSRRALPLNPNFRFMAHGSFSPGLMCTPTVAMHQKCLFERWADSRDYAANNTIGGAAAAAAVALREAEGAEVMVRREGPRGLLPVEFEMLRRLLSDSAQPGPHNTVHLQTNDDYEDGGGGGGGGERPVMFDEPPRTEGIAYIKASAVARVLREGPLAAQPVLYLAQRTFLTQLEKLGEPELMARYRTFRNECPALR